MLLEPFSGGESKSSSGFGLAITREMVNLCRGEMKLVNSGSGILCEIKLPLYLNKGKDIYNVVHETVSEKPSLLLVISHAELRNFLSRSFISDYHVMECDYAEKAFTTMDSKSPDFVICDFELNGIDGLQFFRQFCENQKVGNIPFMLLYGDDESVKLDALHAGVHSCVRKPFNLEELQTMVRNYFLTRENLKRELTSDSQSIRLRNVEINDLQKEILQRLLDFMENHYADPNLSVELLSSELEMSRPQLYRKLHILTGLSVQEFIKSFRLKKAAAFLRTGEQRISDVAYQTGFSDPQHFSKSFKNQFGISPSQYASENRL
jgi:AraC-like DNA-binding protein